MVARRYCQSIDGATFFLESYAAPRAIRQPAGQRPRTPAAQFPRDQDNDEQDFIFSTTNFRLFEDTTLYDFDQQPNGMSPFGGVALDTKGNLYTTAAYGGNYGGEYGGGTVIKVTP